LCLKELICPAYERALRPIIAKTKLRPGKGVFTTLIPDCWYWGIKTWENERLWKVVFGV